MIFSQLFSGNSSFACNNIVYAGPITGGKSQGSGFVYSASYTTSSTHTFATSQYDTGTGFSIDMIQSQNFSLNSGLSSATFQIPPYPFLVGTYCLLTSTFTLYTSTQTSETFKNTDSNNATFEDTSYGTSNTTYQETAQNSSKFLSGECHVYWGSIT